jgi:hypothetical protein
MNRTPGLIRACGQFQGGCICGQIWSAEAKKDEPKPIATCHGPFNPYHDTENPTAEEAKANAAYIVRAWNSHDALVEIAKEFREVIRCSWCNGPKYVDLMGRIDNALKLAEGSEND